MSDSMRPRVLPQRARTAVQNEWLRNRLQTVLPEIMRRERFDMWIISGREYNEDPVMMSLLPAEMLSARRRTILVFSLAGHGGVQRLILSRYGIGDLYRGVWDPEREDQWDCLARVVRERDPGTIGINVLETIVFRAGMGRASPPRRAGGRRRLHRRASSLPRGPANGVSFDMRVRVLPIRALSTGGRRRMGIDTPGE